MIDWRTRTVRDRIKPEVCALRVLFNGYLDDCLFVNRRYQRKLVWTLDEKRLLIDSLLRGIPLPAIQLANYDVEDDKEKKNVSEIIDGLQRLNAIFDFFLGKFDIKWDGKMRYFDTQALTRHPILKEKGLIDEHEGSDHLSIDESCDLYDMQISVITTGSDDETIRMIFERLNSTGRKVSSQDMRQSKSVGEIPNLVRRIASYVRGDLTCDDKISLKDIPLISVGTPELNYGINASDTFWRKHDLMIVGNLRSSSDEEIIESILASILLKDKFKKNKGNLDDLYDERTELGHQAKHKLEEIGADKIEQLFRRTFDELETLFLNVDQNFTEFVFGKKRVKNKDESFKVLFLALYRLISEGYEIEDYKEFVKTLGKTTALLVDAANNYTLSSKNADSVYSILKPVCNKKVVVKNSNVERMLDDRLSYSSIECQMTEFKIGLTSFKTHKFNQRVFEKIGKTLVAMSNTKNAQEGLVIIGIADDDNTYEDWHKIFNDTALCVNRHRVVGIEAEAVKHFSNTDTYFREVTNKIKNLRIPEPLATYVLENMSVVNYRGKELLLLPSKHSDQKLLYDGAEYVRQGSSTIKVK